MNKVLSIFICFIFCESMLANAQTKKIAQRRNNFVNNIPVGLDSTIWDYDAQEKILLRQSTLFAGQWNPFNRDINTYNSAGTLIETIYQEFTNNAWKNVFQYKRIFDTDTNEIEYQRNLWNGTSFVNNNRFIRAFSPTKKLTEEILQNYSSNAWVSLSGRTLVYNLSDDSLNEIAHQSYTNNIPTTFEREQLVWTSTGKLFERKILIPKGNGWTTQSDVFFAYDLKDRIVLENGFKDSNLKADYSKVFTYDVLTDKISTILLKKADTNAIFTNFSIEGFTYNVDSTEKEYTHALYPFGTPQLDSSVSFTYTNALLSEKSTFKYTNGKEENNRFNYTYDNNKNLIYLLWKNDAGSGLVNKREEFYYYNVWPLAVQNTQDIKPISIFPNPAHDALTFELEKEQQGRVSIFDSRGVLRLDISDNLIEQKTKLPISTLEAGTYLLKISTKGSIINAKFTVVK